MHSTVSEVSLVLQAHSTHLTQATIRRWNAAHPPPSQDSALVTQAQRLDQLIQALSLARPALFRDYLAWTKVLLAGRQQSVEELLALLACIRQALAEVLPAALAEIADAYITQAVTQLPQMPTELPTLLDRSAPYDELATSYLKMLLGYDRYAASQLIMAALDSGVALQDIYLHVFQRSQYEIGRLWQINQLTVGQEHFCTAATQLIMSQLYPRIFAMPKHGLNMVAASVSNDLHEMGTRMVADFFEMASPLAPT